MSQDRPVLSIGHSNHDIHTFTALLEQVGVEVVADVRSQPFSRFNSQFNREAVRKALSASGMRYVFLGEELGGRPPEPQFFDADGHVLYGEVAKTERFAAGLRRLLEGAAMFRVAMMCSEEDPTNCHRRLLIARVLSDNGVPVHHIRGDGTVVPEVALRANQAQSSQEALFAEEDSAWRSTRSVSRNPPHKTSSSA